MHGKDQNRKTSMIKNSPINDININGINNIFKILIVNGF